MHKLEQKIIDIECHRLSVNPSLSHLFVETIHGCTDFNMIVLFYYLEQLIEALFAQNHSIRRYMHFFLIDIDILLCTESLKGAKYTCISVGSCDIADV